MNLWDGLEHLWKTEDAEAMRRRAFINQEDDRRMKFGYSNDIFSLQQKLLRGEGYDEGEEVADVKPPSPKTNTIAEVEKQLRETLVGQDHAIDTVLPYLKMFLVRLNPPKRPAGVFMLLGPTGTGKTYLVEALAQAMHGNPLLLRIDCEEFGSSHEVAKLIGCFAPGTQILMGDGTSKAIQDVQVGDCVVTKIGLNRSVVDLHQYEHSGELTRLTLASSNIPLLCTADHKILAIQVGHNGKRIRNPKDLYDPQKLAWIPASELKKHDVVAYPRRQPIQKTGIVDLAPYAEGVRNYEVGETEIKNTLLNRTLPRYIPVDKNFARLAGYYVSEGGNTKDHASINFTLGVPHKNEALEDILALLPKVFGSDPTVKVQDRLARHNKRIYLFSKPIAAMFADLFGANTYEKRLPAWFMDLPDTVLWNFLDAAIMGDGGRTVRRRVQYDTVSAALYSQITTIIRRLGFTTQTQWSSSKRINWKPSYRIYLAGDQIKKFAENLPKAGKGIDATPSKHGQGIQRMSHVDNEYVYFRVTNADKVKYHGPVYDLSVGGEQTNYVAGGICVKNSPPGYLGHRETKPRLTKDALGLVSSSGWPLSILLFDEIEKADPAFHRLLLGILDNGVLKLGDGSSCEFQNTLIFMTSNLGARQTQELLEGNRFGITRKTEGDFARHEKVSQEAVKKFFTPEFLNRVDEQVTFRPLTEESLERIVLLELVKIQQMVHARRQNETFLIRIAEELPKALSKSPDVARYGAREVKRLIQQKVMLPITDLLLECDPKSSVEAVELRVGKDGGVVITPVYTRKYAA